MSEITGTPQPDEDEGTFVGGSFGQETTDGDGTEDVGGTEDVEAAGQDEGRSLTDVFAVGPVGRATDVEGTDEDGADVEGTGTGIAPGERNEPV